MFRHAIDRSVAVCGAFSTVVLAAVLCGMGSRPADSITARELTIVDAAGRSRIYLRVNDQNDAAISLYHPNGQALVMIMAREDGVVDVSVGGPDGVSKAQLRTDQQGNPSLKMAQKVANAAVQSR